MRAGRASSTATSSVDCDRRSDAISLLSVKNYAAGVCASASDAIAARTEWTTGITCMRQMPGQARLGALTAAILGTVEDSVEHRFSGPRGFGQKHIVYVVPVFLHATSNDEEAGGDNFDVLCNLIVSAFRGCNSGQMITDPVTGEQSQLLKIGEELTLKRLEPVLFKRGSSRLRFMAELELSVEELVTG